MSNSNTTSIDPLAYVGIDRFEQPRFLYADRAPLSEDIHIPGTLWFNRISKNIYISQGQGSWVNITTHTSPSGITWNDAATTTTMTVNNGYIVTGGAQVFTLPSTSAIGDVLEVLLNGGTSWQIAQGSGQSIVINAAVTTVGAGGSITTNAAGQTIRLICVADNTTWQTTSLIGNPTVV